MGKVSVLRHLRSIVIIPLMLSLLAFLGWPQSGYAAHDLSNECYACHNIEGGQVWSGSHSIWSGTAIGMSPYSRPITCEICHSDYGNRFKSTSESHHPVAVVTANAMTSDYDNGVLIRCKECHNADDVMATPNLSPDLSPASYDNTAGNSATDGYPDHDVVSPDNQVASGDPPHLMSMLLSGGQRTLLGSGVYNKVPSSNPVSDYGFCLACHDGSANTSRAVNVRQDYLDKGHYFKTTGGGITAGDRIPCSDCHASHNSQTNARLFEPDNTTFVGTRPSGLSFASPYAPTNAEYRAICIFCHNDYNAGNTGNGTPTVRGVEPSPRKYGVAGHAAADTQSCKQCHNPHKTPGGGPVCLTCHTGGGAAGATYDYIDNLFKGVGSDNTATQPAASGSLIWSQHGGFASVGGPANFIYTSPYNTKATNDCFKCHGDRHSNTYKLIDADNTDSYAYSASQGMQDNTASGIANANAFCLTCHDGNGAIGDVRIGGQVPPNVAANWATSGHGRPQASGAYPTSGNNPAYVKCISCHEVHGSNHAKLLPAKKDATGDFVLPSAMPEKTFRSGGSTLLARNVDFTDYSSPASGKGYGTTGDPGNQHAPSGASTGLCDACHRFAGRANGGTDNVTNVAHTHEGIVGDGNQDSPSQMTFTKDCAECHDTHGTTNLEMVNTTINGYALTFTARTGASSFDPAGSGNAVCNVCHEWSGASGPPPLNVDHNYRTWPSAGDTNPEHNPGTNCISCHLHGNATNAAKFGFPQGTCTTCHGNAATGGNWPDNTTSYPDRGGAHAKHVDAIYAANSATLAGASVTAKKNNTCVWCHPGNPPAGHDADSTTGANQAEVIHMDNTGNGFIGPPTAGDYWSYAEGATAVSGTAVRFRNITGANDNDAYYISNATKACSNVDCHAGALTPNWYTGERYDTTPPAWSGGVSGIAATDLAQGGAVSVNWNTATDADHPPVQYILYWSTSAATVWTAGTFMDNVAATSATVTGLTIGTPYYFGVRAKDSATPFNRTTNTDNVSATPTPLVMNWKFKKSTGVAVYTGQTTNLGATCGTSVGIAAVGASGTYPVPGRGLLTMGDLTCSSGSDTNFVYNSSPATSEEQFVVFYTDATYPTATTVTGKATGSSVGIRVSSTATHTIRVRLAGVTSAGAHTLSAGTVTQTVTATTDNAYPLDLSTLSVAVPAGGRLAVVFTWQDAATGASANDHILMDNNATASLMGVISVSGAPPSDTTPPAWPGGISGITVSGTGNGDSLQVSWNTATDVVTPPVKYDLYRGGSAATVFSSPTKTWTNLGTTSIIDSGLTEGTTYYYGVRAKDSVTPTPNVTTNTDTASGTPVSGAPVWTGGVSGISATDLAQGGAVSVNWNTATDADHPPVQYTLYWSTSAATVFTAGTFVDNVAATSATVTGLTNGTPYYFGVRAKDSASPNNQTNNTDNVSATPTVLPGPSSKVYYMHSPSVATTLWGSTQTNLNTSCPGGTTNLQVSTAPGGTTWPGTLPSASAFPAGRGLLATSRVCQTTSTTNTMGSNTTAWNGAWRLFGGFYTVPYASETIVTGSATGNNFGFRSSSGTEDVRILFVAVDNVGNHTMNTNSYVEQLNIPTSMTAYPSLNLGGLSVTVPANGRFAVYLYYYDTSTTGSANHQIAYNSYNSPITNVITVTETPIDTVPPAWPGGVSGITVSGTGNGDSLQVSWNTATDVVTPPVKYDLYRGGSAATVFSSPTKTWTNLGTTSIIDSGLTEGTTYYYGVRAKDSVTPTPNVTTNTDTASGTPRSGGSCNACHAAPPTTGGGAGSHAKHAGTDVIADCEKCHPGASAYSNNHQDGVGQLGFSGTAYNADYTGGQLTYRDGGSVVFYQDTNGYGVLTGGAGDNTDNGTCFRTSTSASYCHGNGSADPVWGGTLAGGCGDCHNSTGKQAALAPTVTMSSTHITAPGGAGSCKDCHAGHYMGVTIPLPPGSWSDPSGRLSGQNMRTRLGIDYTNTGGIHLGGASGSGVVATIAGKTTEAEICWGCHKDVGGANTYGVSEWGYNTKTSPTGYPVAYTAFPTEHDGTSQNINNGWLYANSSYSWSQRTADWTAAYWKNEYNPLIKRRVASVHSASLDPSGQSSSVARNVDGSGVVNRTSPALENKSYIRCSYCHDVHRLGRNGYTPAGQPFLRGTWIGNPYPPEIPPRAAGTSSLGQTYTYTTGVNAGSGAKTPRGLSTARDRGGYFIDQNSGWPTDNAAMNTLALTAGICTLCHDTNVDTMKFYTGSTLWRTGMVNGHSNSTLGGTGSNKRDIFSAFRYPGAYYGDKGMAVQASAGGNPYNCDTSNATNCDPGFPQSTWTVGTDPGTIIVNSGWYGGSVGTYTFGGGDYANWYGSGTIGAAKLPAGSMAHKFTCSKCHSPHATGLPALLTHNCIDPIPAASGGFTINGYDGTNIAANNCHRKTTTTDGWHKLAPGQ